MAKYISVNPTFTPYNVEELLNVPRQIVATSEAQREAYNTNMDKLSVIETLAGNDPEAAPYLQNYYALRDKAATMMSKGSYDPSMVSVNNQLREEWRNMNKVGVGLEAKAKFYSTVTPDTIYLEGRPTLKTFMDNPMYNPKTVNGSDISKVISSLVKNISEATPPRIGEIVPGSSNASKYLYEGISPQEAYLLAATPGNQLSSMIDTMMQDYNFQNLDLGTQQKIQRAVLSGLTDSGQTISIVDNDDLKREQQQASLRNTQLEGMIKRKNYNQMIARGDTPNGYYPVQGADNLYTNGTHYLSKNPKDDTWQMLPEKETTSDSKGTLNEMIFTPVAMGQKQKKDNTWKKFTTISPGDPDYPQIKSNDYPNPQNLRLVTSKDELENMGIKDPADNQKYIYNYKTGVLYQVDPDFLKKIQANYSQQNSTNTNSQESNNYSMKNLYNYESPQSTINDPAAPFIDDISMLDTLTTDF